MMCQSSRHEIKKTSFTWCQTDIEATLQLKPLSKGGTIRQGPRPLLPPSEIAALVCGSKTATEIDHGDAIRKQQREDNYMSGTQRPPDPQGSKVIQGVQKSYYTQADCTLLKYITKLLSKAGIFQQRWLHTRIKPVWTLDRSDPLAERRSLRLELKVSKLSPDVARVGSGVNSWLQASKNKLIPSAVTLSYKRALLIQTPVAFRRFDLKQLHVKLYVKKMQKVHVTDLGKEEILRKTAEQEQLIKTGLMGRMEKANDPPAQQKTRSEESDELCKEESPTHPGCPKDLPFLDYISYPEPTSSAHPPSCFSPNLCFGPKPECFSLLFL
ncbi:hypothetical protein MG293_017319 [Ovis ammon polii]|uniref:Uncharacterized protein n=1 Tax=Ovis ammon polii TaxID=230172 RepID=A0AAD4TT99_OVIAM|nr:hypothetical protein MG293_017319 [Ovis ammon polii]